MEDNAYFKILTAKCTAFSVIALVFGIYGYMKGYMDTYLTQLRHEFNSFSHFSLWLFNNTYCCSFNILLFWFR